VPPSNAQRLASPRNSKRPDGTRTRAANILAVIASHALPSTTQSVLLLVVSR